jgi:signal transduction histidine kinase
MTYRSMVGLTYQMMTGWYLSMLFYFLSLLTAAVIVVFNNRHHESNRWMAFFLSSASIGGLSAIILDYGFLASAKMLQFLNYTFTPYAIVVFSFLYTGFIGSKRARQKLKIYLSAPVVLMIILFFLLDFTQLFFVVLLLWSAPYYLFSCLLLVVSFWKERDIRIKRNRFITAIIIVPTLIAVLCFIYVAKVISPDFEFFNYIAVFIIYSLTVGLLCAFVYGALGVKVRFEHDPMESTMRAVSTGTSMLNHTIKNEIGKIAISMENLKGLMPDSNEQSKQHMQIIMNSSNHMLNMVDRIHSQMKDIILQEEAIRLDQLIDECLLQHEGLFSRQQVFVNCVYELRPMILGDAAHISESIGNVLMNACEAMPDGGTIEVTLCGHKSGIQLSIQDSGAGIPEHQQRKVFDPFYSSGKTGRSFGLGLSYVYNVMQKSGAKIELTSEVGRGTCVSFIWPKKKLLQL